MTQKEEDGYNKNDGQTDDLGEWPSYRFWTKTPERVAQHWYVTFCLLMSAIQDSLIGMALQDKKNLNWSVTTSYYGMIHTGRLLCFVISGSFPKGHYDLCNLLKDSTQPVQLNWLQKFVKDLGPRAAEETDVRTSLCRRDIADKLKRWDSGIVPELESFSNRMDKLRRLRNNSNYEALLIAHEKKHVIVTDCFAKLAVSAQAAARDSMKLAARIYRLYVERSPLLENKRVTFKNLSNEYVKGRLYLGIKEKLYSFRPATEALLELSVTLKFCLPSESRDESNLSELKDFISIHKFGGKTALMEDFSRKIEDFSQCCDVNGKF